MEATEPTPTARRWIRLALLIIGSLLVIYALSDHPLYGGEPGFGRFQYVITAIGIATAIAGLLSDWIAERALLIVAAGLLALPVLEIAGEALLGPKFRPVFQADDRLIFKLIPNRRSVMTRTPLNGGETVEHHINSSGFRGAELLPLGTATRVVVYGDSFIHAAYTRDDQTFAAVLGARLNANVGGKVEVVNAGVSSYGPDQILLKMEDELPRLRPKIAIVAIFAGNDYGDLMRDKMFRLDDQDELVAAPWKLDPTILTNFQTSQKESILIRALRESLRNSRWSPVKNKTVQDAPQTSQFTQWDFLLAEAQREYDSFILKRNQIVTNTHVDYYSADVSLTPRSESARYKIRLMQAVLKRIKEVALRHHVQLAFLFIPHPTAVTTNYGWPTVDVARYPDYRPRNEISPLEDCAKAIGIPYVSLYDSFRALDANTLYFHDGDDHWNAAGQRIAAEMMATLIGENFRSTMAGTASTAR